MLCASYRAFVRLFARVPSHVHNQHILGFERLFVARARLPTAYKRLLVAMNVIGVNMTDELVLREKLEPAASPVTVRLEEDAPVILGIGRVGQDGLAARATAVVVARS